MAFGRRARARLDLGDAPQVAPLRDLDIDTGPGVHRLPARTTHGVLDDHFECWFLTSRRAGRHEPTEGLESVIDLGRSEEWLDPPKVRVG